MRRWIALLTGATALVLLDATAVQEAARHFELAHAENPYFVPRQAWLLYGRLPLVVLASLFLMIAPGLLLASALYRNGRFDARVLGGIGLSLLLVGGVTSVLTWLGISPTGREFALLLFALAMGCLGIVRFTRRGVGRGFASPDPDRDPARLIVYLLPVVLLLIALLPKFLWESFNGDGAHAFEASRLLLQQPFPFWDSASGPVSRFPGLTTMLFTFPGSWFIRLFGEIEVSVRLPFLLHMTALYAAVCSVVRASVDDVRRRVHLKLPDRGLIWLGLAVYALVMAFSATYSPYHADIALPGAQDTLFLACFLGFVHGFVRDDLSEMALFLTLCATGLPSWILLVTLWLLAVLIAWRPLPRRRLLRAGALAATAFFVFSLAPTIMAQFSFPVPGGEYSGGALLERLRLLRFTEWRRWLYFLIPGGILPSVYMLAWHRQDRIARALSLVAGAYFVFFYVQAYTSLHHYLPAAVLPLAVLWRDPRGGASRQKLRAAALTTGLVALLLAIPSRAQIHTHAREVGHAVDDRRVGYERFEPAIFSSLNAYTELFPTPVHPAVPDARYGGSPLVWNYYAHHRRKDYRTTYLWLPTGSAPPAEATRIDTTEYGSLYVLDLLQWARDRTYYEPPSISAPFVIRKNILFRGGGDGSDPEVRDLRAALQSLLPWLPRNPE